MPVPPVEDLKPLPPVVVEPDEAPMLTVLPPPAPPRLFKALAMSSASAYLIGMTSEIYSAGTDTSMRSIICNIRFTFSALSRSTRMPLLSIGRMEFASFANGWMIGTISLGLTFFNCTMCVTYDPRSGKSAASDSSLNSAPAVLAWSTAAPSQICRRCSRPKCR